MPSHECHISIIAGNGIATLTVVVELDIPPPLLLLSPRSAVHNLIAHDLDVLRLGPQELHEQRADDGRHARGEHDDGDVRGARPGVEGLEMGVQGDVLAEEGDALEEGRVDAVDHFLEGFAVGGGGVRVTRFLGGGGGGNGGGLGEGRGVPEGAGAI